jgi:nucleolin
MKPQKKAKKEEKKEEKKPAPKKIESDDEDDSSEDKPKKEEKKPEKKQPSKKVESDDDDEDSDDKPKKGEKKPEKKPQPKKKDMSDSDSDSDSDKKEKPKQKPKKVEKSEEEEPEEESNGAKKTAKKEESSDEEDKKEEKENENEEELPSNVFEELFVRNIGYDTTQEGLAEYFAKYGDVEESKIVTDKNTGKSRGFGFLKFYEKRSAYNAMKDAENIVVDGRNLQIRYSNDKSSQMKGGNNSAKKGPASEFGVFVGNISYKCTENDLKKFFKDCGKVLDVRIAKKPDGKLKGFAHVDFETKEGMEKAVEKNGKELQGRALKVDKSSSGNGGRGNGGNRGQGRGRGGNNADPMAKAKRTGGIIAPTENKVTTYDDSDDDE